MTSHNLLHIAQEVADRLSNIDGVLAVSLGGSLARGAAHPDSDIDLGLYYDSNHPPSVSQLNQLAAELDDRHRDNLVTGFGEWGEWINGGAWLKIKNQSIDWLYRDISLVDNVISNCQAGISNCYYYPGHPHGFHDHYYLADIYYAHVLYDKSGILSSFKEKIKYYPPSLKKTLVEKYLWEATFALQTSFKAANREDVFYVSGCFFRCIACLIQVLFALNERYINNEKGAVKISNSFVYQPPQFNALVTSVLGNPGTNNHELLHNIRKLELLVEEVRGLSINT